MDTRRLQRARAAKRGRRAAANAVSVLPTLLTLGNLLAGFAAIFFASRAYKADVFPAWAEVAAVFVFLGLCFDGLDGRVARMTRNTSDLGEQLDSMADMVTFGVAPAFLTLQLIGLETPFGGGDGDRIFDRAVVAIAALYVACAALRLARFNVEKHDGGTAGGKPYFFTGLPSPGAAGTVASLVLLHQNLLHQFAGTPAEWTVKASTFTLVFILLLTALAMVSRLRYVHVMNRYMRGRARFEVIAKVVIVGILLLMYPQGALALAFAVYALSAPVFWLWRRVGGNDRPTPTMHTN